MQTDIVKMTQAEFARHWGVKRQTVGKYVARGKIKLDERGKIDVAAAELALGNSRERVNTPRLDDLAGDDAPVAPKSEPDGLTRARTEVAAIAARRGQLEYEQQLGKLVEASQVAEAATICAESLVRIVLTLSMRCEELFDAGVKDGMVGVRSKCREIEHDLRADIAAAMTKFAADATAKKKADQLVHGTETDA